MLRRYEWGRKPKRKGLGGGVDLYVLKTYVQKRYMETKVGGCTMAGLSDGENGYVFNLGEKVIMYKNSSGLNERGEIQNIYLLS